MVEDDLKECPYEFSGKFIPVSRFFRGAKNFDLLRAFKVIVEKIEKASQKADEQRALRLEEFNRF